MFLIFKFPLAWCARSSPSCVQTCSAEAFIDVELWQCPGSPYRGAAGRLSYPFGGIWPSVAAASGTSLRPGSIQSLSVGFQFPVPGGERQFASPRWTHAIVVLSFGVVCAIFQFLKINVIFGVLCCATADWMEGGAESSCKVVWAEAVSCCREQFVEATKGKSPLLLQDPFTWWWWSSCKLPTYLWEEKGEK